MFNRNNDKIFKVLNKYNSIDENTDLNDVIDDFINIENVKGEVVFNNTKDYILSFILIFTPLFVFCLIMIDFIRDEIFYYYGIPIFIVIGARNSYLKT